jgi:hypothetical protein
MGLRLGPMDIPWRGLSMTRDIKVVFIKEKKVSLQTCSGQDIGAPIVDTWSFIGDADWFTNSSPLCRDV